MNYFRAVLILLLALLTLHCGGEKEETIVEEDTSGPGTFGNNPTADAEGGEGNNLPTPANFGVAIEEKLNEVLSGGQKVYFSQFIPEGCTDDSPCPLLILVPDLLASGDAFFGENSPRWIAAKTGAVVVTYNPPGRGYESRKSTGDEDYHGSTGQDALSDVMNFNIKALKTNEQVGVISFGYGLVAAAGALSRFQSTKLKEVDFLIDVEGPINRCWATATPADAEAGVDTDGPGVSDKRCDFDIGPRIEAFPFLLEGAPAAVICNENSPMILSSGMDCEEDLWWQEREAKYYLDDIKGSYLRIQMKIDHRQASLWGDLEAIKYVVKSDADHQLNNLQENEPVHTIGESSCIEQGCFLEFDGLGNSLVLPTCDADDSCTENGNPYSGGFPDYAPFNLESFSENILPLYVERMLNL